jgi:hypothetical protein
MVTMWPARRGAGFVTPPAAIPFSVNANAAGPIAPAHLTAIGASVGRLGDQGLDEFLDGVGNVAGQFFGLREQHYVARPLEKPSPEGASDSNSIDTETAQPAHCPDRKITLLPVKEM